MLAKQHGIATVTSTPYSHLSGNLLVKKRCSMSALHGTTCLWSTQSEQALDMWCRTWTLIFGAALTGTMTFVPTFRHFRIYNIISLTGTAYSALYLIIAATCKSARHLCACCSRFFMVTLQCMQLTCLDCSGKSLLVDILILCIATVKASSLLCVSCTSSRTYTVQSTHLAHKYYTVYLGCCS